MKITLSEAFLGFFAEHQIIEFTDVFSKETIDSLEELLHQQLPHVSSNTTLWKKGQNLWIQEPQIQNILSKSPIGTIASFLFKQKPLRLGFTQSLLVKGTDQPISHAYSLQEISSLSPIVGGALIVLSSSYTDTQENPLPSLTKLRTGRLFFFSTTFPIPFPSLFSQKDLHCLLLCFTPPKVRYVHNPKDIHTHVLKTKGYGFGDLLSDAEAPILR